MPRHRLTLIVLGILLVASAVSMTRVGGIIILLLAFSGVGIPIAFLVAVLPTITGFVMVVLVLTAILDRLAFSRLFLNIALAVIIVVGAAWLATKKINNDLEERAAMLMADDHDLVGPVKPVSTLAVVEDVGYYQRGICDALCQRALLNHAVDAIIMVRVKSVAQPLSADWKGIRYRIEKRAQCPSVGIDVNDGLEPVKGEKRTRGSKTPRDLLLIEAAKGNCLISEPAKVGDAEAVLVSGVVKRGLLPDEAGFAPYADTASAVRLTFFRYQETGFVERYRSTFVELYSLTPVVNTIGESLMSNKAAPQWYRAKMALEVRPFAKDINSPLAFTQERLGFDLLLKDDWVKQDMRAVISDAVDGVRPLPIDGANALFVYFDGFRTVSEISPEDLTLSLRVMAEKRVPLVINTDKVVALIAKSHPEAVSGMAASLFSRLEAASQPNTTMNDRVREREILSTSKAIHALPDSAVLPYFDILSSVAGNAEVRRAASDAIKKLSAFGDQAVPVLIGLIDSIAPLPTKASQGRSLYEWQEPYLAAMMALCRAGPRAKTALPLLRQRMPGETLAHGASYERLLQNTLSRLSTEQADTPAVEATLYKIGGPCSY